MGILRHPRTNRASGPAVRRAPEEELKYVRVSGVCEKVDEQAAIAEYGVAPVDTRWRTSRRVE